MDDQTYHALEQYLDGIITVQKAHLQGNSNPRIQNLEDQLKNPQFVGTLHYLLRQWGLNLKKIGVNATRQKLHIKSDMWPDVLQNLIYENSLDEIKAYYTNVPGNWTSTIVVHYDDLDKALDLIDEYTNIISSGYEVDIDALPLEN